MACLPRMGIVWRDMIWFDLIFVIRVFVCEPGIHMSDDPGSSSLSYSHHVRSSPHYTRSPVLDPAPAQESHPADRRSRHPRLRRRWSVSLFTPDPAHIPSQRPARSTTSPTRNAIQAHSSHSTRTKRRSSYSAVAGVRQVYSNISTPRITTPSVSLLLSSLLSHISLRSSSVQRTFSSLPLSSPLSQSVHSAHVPSYSVCPLRDPLSLSHLSHSHSFHHKAQGQRSRRHRSRGNRRRRTSFFPSHSPRLSPP